MSKAEEQHRGVVGGGLRKIQEQLPDATREQKYCISARDRVSGYTEDITGPMSQFEAKMWTPTSSHKKTMVYFKVSKYPFKKHKKGS